MTRFSLLFSVLTILPIAATPACHAGIIASFTQDGLPLGLQTISVGQFVDLDLYLHWNGDGINYLNSPGLIAAGLGVSSSQIGVASAVSGEYGGDWTPDPLFSATTIETPAGWSGISVIQDINVLFSVPGTVVIVPGPPTTQYAYLKVGALKYQGVAAGTVTLALADYSPLDDTITDFVLPDLPVVLDGLITFGQTTQIKVPGGAAAVPEPATGVIAGIGCLLGLFKASMNSRRKSKRNSTSVADSGC